MTIFKTAIQKFNIFALGYRSHDWQKVATMHWHHVNISMDSRSSKTLRVPSILLHSPHAHCFTSFRHRSLLSKMIWWRPVCQAANSSVTWLVCAYWLADLLAHKFAKLPRAQAVFFFSSEVFRLAPHHCEGCECNNWWSRYFYTDECDKRAVSTIHLSAFRIMHFCSSKTVLGNILVLPKENEPFSGTAQGTVQGPITETIAYLDLSFRFAFCLRVRLHTLTSLCDTFTKRYWTKADLRYAESPERLTGL